jgi:hypothetical protein
MQPETMWADRMGGTPCTKGSTTIIISGGTILASLYFHTWLVQTLLKVTNEKVCANIVDGRSFFANNNGSATAERNSCGMNAKDSRCMYDGLDAVELEYKMVL